MGGIKVVLVLAVGVFFIIGVIMMVGGSVGGVRAVVGGECSVGNDLSAGYGDPLSVMEGVLSSDVDKCGDFGGSEGFVGIGGGSVLGASPYTGVVAPSASAWDGAAVAGRYRAFDVGIRDRVSAAVEVFATAVLAATPTGVYEDAVDEWTEDSSERMAGLWHRAVGVDLVSHSSVAAAAVELDAELAYSTDADVYRVVYSGSSAPAGTGPLFADLSAWIVPLLIVLLLMFVIASVVGAARMKGA